jgi:hypothetical protein
MRAIRREYEMKRISAQREISGVAARGGASDFGVAPSLAMSVPPHASGATSEMVCEKVQTCPPGSSTLYCRSP